jgi:hypothetical protein
MKKFLFLSLVALAAACCGPKNEVCVDKLIASPADYLGKEVAFTGKAVVKCAASLAVYGTDTTKYIMVQVADTTVKVCGTMCGKAVKVVGTVAEAVADTAVAAEKFFVVAKSIEKAECCKKDGKECCKKDGKECKKDDKKCCKKDSTATCPKAAEGAKAKK